VLPAAREHRCGIVAMKVFGGPPGWRYRNPVPPIVPKERYADAVRYSLSVPGVATAVIGMLTPEQVRENAAMVRTFRPLSPDEAATLSEEGKALAARWGAHRGPAS
jgi:predicted aldo/keto reductase-like oxidoreductase